jgi:hypothetical protein
VVTAHRVKTRPAALLARISGADSSRDAHLLRSLRATSATAVCRGQRRRRVSSCRSSIREGIGAAGLVPARTMKATAAECLLPVTSQAIRKHLRDRGVGAGVSPQFMAKRNAELVGIRDGGPTTPSVRKLANCASLAIPHERPLVASKRGPGGARRGASACPRQKKSRAFGPTVTTTSGPRRGETRRWRRARPAP